MSSANCRSIMFASNHTAIKLSENSWKDFGPLHRRLFYICSIMLSYGRCNAGQQINCRPTAVFCLYRSQFVPTAPNSLALLHRLLRLFVALLKANSWASYSLGCWPCEAETS